MQIDPQQQEKVVREIGSLFSSAFDPAPICFRPDDERGVRPVRAACQKPDGTFHSLRRSLNRNAFLVGCLDFTETEEVEHLVMGLGAKHGRTTKVVGILHKTGSTSSVQVTSDFEITISQHLRSEHRAEVLVFHNHPRNVLNTFFDNDPLASAADRRWFLSASSGRSWLSRL